MDRSRKLCVPLIVAMVITSIALVSSCRRAPEPDSGPTTEVEAPVFDYPTLELPQHNSEIGISLNGTPNDLAATYNDNVWIELRDKTRPSVLYAFVATPQVSPGVTPASVAEFETRIRASIDGRLVDNGVIKTELGRADWSAGTYPEDGVPMEDVHVFVPHPSGTGTVIVYSLCPVGVATIEERLDVIRELVANIS